MSQSIYLLEFQSEITSVCANGLRLVGYQVRTFGHAEEFLKALVQSPPALAVLAVTKPGLEGLEILRRVRQRSDCMVLLTSVDALESDRILGLDQGADDFLLKPFSVRELVSRTRALLRRHKWDGDEVQERRKIERCGDFCLDLDGKTIGLGEVRESLTSSEFSILRRMMKAPTKVFSRDELLQPPYRQRGASHRAIDMHMANLRRKIEMMRPGLKALVSVRGVGYRFKV